jgi:hypothetical protein|tara:strand:- start:572 stop:823 length:252 start_codon:yes stop_codon:yes gene_type:complete
MGKVFSVTLEYACVRPPKGTQTLVLQGPFQAMLVLLNSLLENWIYLYALKIPLVVVSGQGDGKGKAVEIEHILGSGTIQPETQ